MIGSFGRYPAKELATAEWRINPRSLEFDLSDYILSKLLLGLQNYEMYMCSAHFICPYIRQMQVQGYALQ